MMSGRRPRGIAGLGALALAASVVVAPATMPTSALAADDQTPSGGCRAQDTPEFTKQPNRVLDLMQAQQAWGITRGKGVRVAIVDSGINASDPRLAGRVVGGIDLVRDGTDKNGYTDLDGHGTRIAGMIAGQPRPHSTMQGLAPDVQLYSVRVYRDNSQDERTQQFRLTTARVAAGIRAAADFGAQIINVSISAGNVSDVLDEAVRYARSRGALVIASSGNVEQDEASISATARDTIRYPAGSPGAIGVAATTLEGDVTDASVHGAHVQLAAPGQQILSIGLNGGDCWFPGPTANQGLPSSSYATAYASGSAALVASAHPDETPDQWLYRLEASALRGDPDRRNNRSGWGVVQPYQAIVLTPGPTTRGPASPFFKNATPAPQRPVQPKVVAEPSHQREEDMTQLLTVGAVTLGALGLFGVVTTFTTARRRRERAAAAAVSAEAERSPAER